MGCFGGINERRKQYGFTFTFVVFAALNIGMMYSGIVTIHKCPIEPMIPNYLIVAGSTSLSLLLVRLIVSRFLLPEMDETTEVLRKEEGKEAGEEREKMLAVQWTVHALRIYDSLASIFSTCWLIVGSVYVYGKHSSVTFANVKEATYCDYNAYTFAFVVITIGYVSLGLSILAALCACCFKRES